MEEKQLNIKSSTIEKGLELAKDFLGKLIGPTVEELGLLISGGVKYLRFKNEVNVLLKAKKYVEEKGLTTKQIPIKILVPLLQNASLEEDEEMQDKWATMIGNMVDSASNLQNHIFPYILNQIALEEYEGLKKILSLEKGHLIMRHELIDLELKEKSIFPSRELLNLRNKVTQKEQEGFTIDLEEFQYSNLERLGVIRRLPPRIFIPEFKTSSDTSDQWHQLEPEYDTFDYGYRITELGEKFLTVCEPKL